MIVAFVLAAAAAAAVPAAAAEVEDGAADLTRSTPGVVYFNRPGADITLHNAELRDCIKLVSTAHAQDPGMGGILPMLMHDLQDDRTLAANVENCMVVKGWRVVRLPDSEKDAVAALKAEGKEAMITPWVGVAEPHGQVVRWWDNDAAKSATHKYKQSAYFGRSSLSVAGLPKVDEPKPDDIEPPKLPKHPKSANSPKPLKPEAYAVPAGFALVLTHLKGIGMSSAQGISFLRISPDPKLPAWAVDQLPDQVMLTYASVFTGSDGKMLAYALPPGRWRLGAMINGLTSLDLCLGSPAFEVRAGQVLWLGSIDARAADLGPDMNLQPAQEALAGQPALQQKLEAASYVNGTTATCAGNYTYALEFKGGSYEPGYAWGGAARSAASPQAPAARTPTLIH